MNHVHYINTLRINMDLYTINYIKNNPIIHNYLREEPSWYKQLNRSSKNLKPLEELAKKHYKLTPQDRLESLSQSINIINNFLDVLK